MKQHTLLEKIFIAAAFAFLLLKIVSDRNGAYYHFFPFGLYFFTGLSVTSKTLRFFDTLEKKSKVMCVVSVLLIHAAAIGSLIFPNKDLNVVWMVGILLFALGGQSTLQKHKA